MSHLSNRLILTSNIQIVTINVTEKINTKFLNEFIATTLKTNQILCDDNTYIWYKFIEQINLYEIYVVYSLSNNFVIEPQILSKFYDKNIHQKGVDLFILENFFALYNKGELYCFKGIEKSNIEDIKNYCVQTYQLPLDNIYKIDDSWFKQLQVAYEKDLSNQANTIFTKLKGGNAFLFFSIFAFVSICIFTFFTYNSFSNISNSSNERFLNIQKKYNKLKLQSQNSLAKINYTKITPKLIELFKYIKLENLTIAKIAYAKNQLQLVLLHKDKNKLLNFLTIYDHKTIIQKIEFLKEQNLYTMVINIEI